MIKIILELITTMNDNSIYQYSTRGNKMTIRAAQIKPKTDVMFYVFRTNGGKKPNGEYYFTGEIGLRFIYGNTDSYFTFPLGDHALLVSKLGQELFDKARTIIEPLHLSARDGSPMYAVENGFYYVQIANGVAKWHEPKEGDKEKYTKILAEHLRVSIEEAQTIVQTIKTYDEFIAVVDTMRDRWEQEAITAYEFLCTELIPLSDK